MERTMSMTKVAKSHGVPSTTLKDRMSGKVVHGSKPGRKRYLNNYEEESLAEHLVEAASIGYGKTRAEVKSIAEKIAVEKNILQGDKVTVQIQRETTNKAIIATWSSHCSCMYGFNQ